VQRYVKAKNNIVKIQNRKISADLETNNLFTKEEVIIYLMV